MLVVIMTLGHSYGCLHHSDDWKFWGFFGGGFVWLAVGFICLFGFWFCLDFVVFVCLCVMVFVCFLNCQ